MRTPSRFVCSAGTTSLTVRSTKIPPTKRKHFRPGSSARASSRVVRTRLDVAAFRIDQQWCRLGCARVFLCFLFELADLAGQGLKVILKTRVCLLYFWLARALSTTFPGRNEVPYPALITVGLFAGGSSCPLSRTFLSNFGCSISFVREMMRAFERDAPRNYYRWL